MVGAMRGLWLSVGWLLDRGSMMSLKVVAGPAFCRGGVNVI
jgi:hypothetical protein